MMFSRKRLNCTLESRQSCRTVVLKVVSYMVVEEDCAADGVIQRLEGLDETLIYAKLSENLP